MNLKTMSMILVILSYVPIPAFAMCNKYNQVFFCQTKDNTQINLCKKGNQYHYEYGYIGYKPKQKLVIPKKNVTFEYYVIEGVRNFYSIEFMHKAVKYSINTNYPRDKTDKMPAFANMIQSQNQGDKIVAMATCRMDTLTDNLKKYQSFTK